MRGIAAVFVTLFHLGHAGVTQFSPQGYLAVDFFFILSGLVIAMSYSDRLRSDMSIRTFLERRAIRFFPLYLFGLALGAAKAAATFKLDPASFGLNILMLPTPFSERLFPYNSPSWSLFLELAVNLLFALVLVRLSARMLVAVAAMALVGMFATIGAPDNFNVGWAWHNLPAGMFRTVYAFAIGMLLARWLVADPVESWTFLLPVALLVAMLALPKAGLPFEFVAATILFPLIVAWGGKVEVVGWLRPLFTFLGDISFALYAIHWPLMGPIVSVGKKLGFSSPLIALLYLSIIIPLAYLVQRWFDGPARRALSLLRWPSLVRA
jgi:peptidoglycan/LPS O-acetylase OafA/YrhL